MAKIIKSKITMPLAVILVVLIGLLLVVRNMFAAPRVSSETVKYTIPQTASSMAISGDLKYYGFIKHESAYKVALFFEGEIFGKNIKRSAVYDISQSMNTWQIASVLLNKGTSVDCSHGCPENNFVPELLPGGDLVPTIKQKYEGVTTYEDCVKSIGHDGGQLSSEQYAERTGIRKCVSPDGREFTQGKEGWTNAVGG